MAGVPNPNDCSNFNCMPEAKTAEATTLDNLKAAVTGETGASAKYAAYAADADAKGFKQAASLWRAASAAEQIHIALEYKLASTEDPSFQKPTAPTAAIGPVDTNLIDSAYGEIFETSDMYPTFIKKAQAEGKTTAVEVFTRAKMAEAYHAQLYIDAYNTLDHATDEKYYLCPGCGYIHKGDNFDVCPICGAPKSVFKEF